MVMKSKKFLEWGPGGDDITVSTDMLESAWYVRASAGADAVRAALGDVSFLARSGAPAGETAYLTGVMTRPELNEKLGELKKLSVFRVLD